MDSMKRTYCMYFGSDGAQCTRYKNHDGPHHIRPQSKSIGMRAAAPSGSELNNLQSLQRAWHIHMKALVGSHWQDN